MHPSPLLEGLRSEGNGSATFMVTFVEVMRCNLVHCRLRLGLKHCCQSYEREPCMAVLHGSAGSVVQLPLWQELSESDEAELFGGMLDKAMERIEGQDEVRPN